MSENNKKQTNKTTSRETKSSVNKPNSPVVSEAEQVKAALDNAKDSIKKTLKDSASKTEEKIEGKSLVADGTEKSSATKHEENSVKTDKKTKSQSTSPRAESLKLDSEASTESIKQAPTKSASIEKPKQIIKKAPTDRKSKGVGVPLALLLGLVGTGLGAYSFNELRMLKNGSGSNVVTEKILSLEGQLEALEKNDQSSELTKQLTILTEQGKVIQNSEEQLKSRLAKIEQIQSGSEESLKVGIEKAIGNRMKAVGSLLDKVRNIELNQQGLSKNLTEVSAMEGGANVNSIIEQEVGYLLRLANYKIRSESDIHGATGLLKIAESRLLASHDGAATPLVDSVREKLIQLSGVKTVDENTLLNSLESISSKLAKLTVKQFSRSTANDLGEKVEADSVIAQIGSMIASGVKYTPKDPSKIDISAETALIEKRLLQIDIKTAELAVRSRNKVLLTSSIQSIKDSLTKYFAMDEVSQYIVQTLDEVARNELNTILPDLSGLVSQFENEQ